MLEESGTRLLRRASSSKKCQVFPNAPEWLRGRSQGPRRLPVSKDSFLEAALFDETQKLAIKQEVQHQANQMFPINIYCKPYFSLQREINLKGQYRKLGSELPKLSNAMFSSVPGTSLGRILVCCGMESGCDSSHRVRM